MGVTPLAKARDICTSAELELVRAARPPLLGKMNERELKTKIARARKLRDKWRDLAERQRRETQQQQGSRTTDTQVQARTREKAELFGETLAALEAQLAKGAAGSGGAGVTKRGPAKAKRAAGHRATRAQVREELAAKQAALSGEEPPKKAKKKSAAKKSAAQKGVKKSAEAPAAPVGGKAAAKKKTAKKKAAKKKAARKAVQKKKAGGANTSVQPSAATGPGDPGLTAPKKQQRRAATAAKATRIKKSGLTTRTRGHVSARGKRSQAARDRRN